MNNTYQLYLKLKKLEEGQHVDTLLQKSGFKKFKTTGSEITHFRNYYYQLPNSPNQCEIHFRISPNEVSLKTIAINLFFGITQSSMHDLFERLVKVQQALPFNLLDLELRNKYYAKLHEAGKVDQYFVGLPKEEQKKIEESAYIILNFSTFQKNLFGIEKRNRFFLDTTDIGERAPIDDSEITTSGDETNINFSDWLKG